METTTAKPAATAGTLHLSKPPGATQAESTQAATRFEGTADKVSRASQTSRFPPRAQLAVDEGQPNLETKIEDFFSNQDWAESARNEVRAHPLAVVGVALVAGLLIGRL